MELEWPRYDGHLSIWANQRGVPWREEDEGVGETLGLTPAESRLAVMVASGHTLRDIATVTERSYDTVRWHLQKIFRKQGISRQAALVRRVLSLDGFPESRR